MKKVLIISPYFPPSNAADMQRVRMSLPYFKEFGWDAEVVVIDEKYSEIVKDELLVESLPSDIVVHRVKALSKKLTGKIGLGSIALRSIYFYHRYVKKLLNTKSYSLIYFSTTQFPVLVLGKLWKRKFGIPFIVDMQDPWRPDYYLNKPKHQQPPKFWFTYKLDTFLESKTIPFVDGIISVSESYIETLKKRYPEISTVPSATITFGVFPKDFEISKKHATLPAILNKNRSKYCLMYVGRGGHDMKESLSLLFSCFKKGLSDQQSLFSQFHFYFIGTSYAASGKGTATITPLAEEFQIQEYVTEETNRIPFYQGLNCLSFADGLVVPGSNDPAYTASKLYPYILAKKPLLAIFNKDSSAIRIINECNSGITLPLDTPENNAYNQLHTYLLQISNNNYINKTDWSEFSKYTAKEMTRNQCVFFDHVIAPA